jgi:hypothetical protein
MNLINYLRIQNHEKWTAAPEDRLEYFVSEIGSMLEELVSFRSGKHGTHHCSVLVF